MITHINARHLAGIFIALLWLSGCSATPQVALLNQQTPPDLPSRVELVDVPFYPQQEFYCGPAALAAIFNFYGVDVTPEQLGERMVVPKLQGSLQTEVVAAVRSYDMVPFRQDGQLLSLMRELDRGNPVFVLQNLGLDSLPVWHYELLIGYDLDLQVMILRSDVYPRIERDFETFERTWTRAGNWSLVVVPPPVMPLSVSEDSYLDEAVAFEQLGRTRTAATLYDNAIGRWPNNNVAWLGKGNLSYQRGDFAGAESAYRQSLQLNDQQAALWNNLAFSLIEQDRRNEALQAIERSISLEPGNASFLQSREEIRNWP